MRSVRRWKGWVSDHVGELVVVLMIVTALALVIGMNVFLQYTRNPDAPWWTHFFP